MFFLVPHLHIALMDLYWLVGPCKQYHVVNTLKAAVKMQMVRAEQALKDVEAERHAWDANAAEMKEEIDGKLNFQMQVAQKKSQVAARRDVLTKNLARIEENELAAEQARSELLPAYEKALEVCY